MFTEKWFASRGTGQIHVCCWSPAGKPRAVLQIIHGIAEYAARYEEFAEYLNTLGFLVVAEDHMGHGESTSTGGVQGYFHGGWFRAVEDSYNLLRTTKEENPDIPYVLFGHSMGSFMARTILCKYPDSGITAAVICGTGWQPRAMLPFAVKICEAVCKRVGEENPSQKLQDLVFGGYNKKVPDPRTEFDWLSRDAAAVDAYIAHPMCGFTASSGLLRDMLKGISYVEDPANLSRMRKELPVLFVAGDEDPVGSYGKGVREAEKQFRAQGLQDISCILYPGGRHEILNETNRQEVFRDVSGWLAKRGIPG